MKLARLLIHILIVVVMALGSYMDLQGTGGGQRTLPMDEVGICTEQASGEEKLASEPFSSAPHEDGESVPDCSSGTAEEEPEGDEFLSEPELSILGHGRDGSSYSPLKLTSHVADLAERPPRVRIA